MTTADEWLEEARQVVPPNSLDTHTDDANALRLINKHGHEYRRISDMRRWYRWDSKQWGHHQEDHNIRQAARELARELPEVTAGQKTYKRNSLSSAGISGAVRVAETDPRAAILTRELDSHPGGCLTPRAGSSTFALVRSNHMTLRCCSLASPVRGRLRRATPALEQVPCRDVRRPPS